LRFAFSCGDLLAASICFIAITYAFFDFKSSLTDAELSSISGFYGPGAYLAWVITNVAILLKSTRAVLEGPDAEEWAELMRNGHRNCGVCLLKGEGACMGLVPERAAGVRRDGVQEHILIQRRSSEDERGVQLDHEGRRTESEQLSRFVGRADTLLRAYGEAERAVDVQPNRVHLVYGETGVMGQLRLDEDAERREPTAELYADTEGAIQDWIEGADAAEDEKDGLMNRAVHAKELSKFQHRRPLDLDTISALGYSFIAAGDQFLKVCRQDLGPSYTAAAYVSGTAWIFGVRQLLLWYSLKRKDEKTHVDLRTALWMILCLFCASTHFAGRLMREILTWQQTEHDIGMMVSISITILFAILGIVFHLGHSKELHGWEFGHVGQAIPQRVQISNELIFVSMIFFIRVMPSGENRFAMLLPPNAAKLQDLDQASALVTVIVGYVWQNWATWTRMLRLQMDIWRVELKKERISSPGQLVWNWFLPDMWKEEQYAELLAERQTRTVEPVALADASGIEGIELQKLDTVSRRRG
jgi:hypothetical protein